jgi:predicted ribosome quality control (RQC) complex YloA/Tae2 family protein
VGKYEKRLRIRRKTGKNSRKTIVESKKKGDLLYSHYSDIQNIMILSIRLGRDFPGWR